MSGPKKEVVQLQIDNWTKENLQNTNITQAGFDWFQLSEAEAEVFDIDLENWPRLLACWMVYEAVLGICDNGLDELTWLKLQEYRQTQDWLEECRMSLENFQRFGQEFGFSFRETHALYWKQDFYHVRSGTTSYKDEPD